ncbi:MAG: tRNA-dihydrouridine synthase family protein [Lentisphaeraceae bacterium]|nr:tRNA-dihydrouridine synthase family protein [Lentisphaeraceae bacterium]
MDKKYTRELPIKTTTFPYQPATMLAPMEGITNHPVRTAISGIGGVGVVCTEFVRVSVAELKPKEIRSVMRPTEGVPLSVQIMGNKPKLMADTARKFSEAGADIVDINLGCPTARAVKGNVGSAMLKDPDLLFDVLSAMRKNISGLQSAKIRAGFDNADHTLLIAEAVEAAGVDFIVVHPRRRNDFYEGVADWRIIGMIKERLKIPVVGNGDIWYPSDAARMYKECGCDAVMIGRGALRNPWIFKQLEDDSDWQPSPEEVFNYIDNFMNDHLNEFEGHEGGVIKRAKENWRYLCQLFVDGNTVGREILRQQSYSDFRNALQSFLESKTKEDFDFFGHLELKKSGSGI